MTHYTPISFVITILFLLLLTNASLIGQNTKQKTQLCMGLPKDTLIEGKQHCFIDGKLYIKSNPEYPREKETLIYQPAKEDTLQVKLFQAENCNRIYVHFSHHNFIAAYNCTDRDVIFSYEKKTEAGWIDQINFPIYNEPNTFLDCGYNGKKDGSFEFFISAKGEYRVVLLAFEPYIYLDAKVQYWYSEAFLIK